MSSVQGKTVIVTGSGGGLGRVIAGAYLEAGANVVICDVNPERVETVVKELEAANHPGKLFSITVDVTNEDSVSSLISQTVEKFGRLDILVNNAGVMDTMDGVSTLTKERWDQVMGVNALGPFLMSKAAVNQFQAQDAKEADNGSSGGGIILNISSSASSRGTCAGAAYTASKHALDGLTKNTAGFYQEQGIFTIALSLGAMPQTLIHEGLQEKFSAEGYMKMQASSVPFDATKHVLDLKDVAKYCLFLSDRGVACTSNGSCITFNKNWPFA